LSSYFFENKIKAMGKSTPACTLNKSRRDREQKIKVRRKGKEKKGKKYFPLSHLAIHVFLSLCSGLD
jgi:hypothetical protein